MRRFTKSDLKDTMIVVNREGNSYIFFAEKNIFTREEFYLNLSYYDDNLENIDGIHKFDIMKVYAPVSSKIISNFLNPEEFEPIWEREEQVELTLQEIADKFDIPVEKLRIKD